MNENRYQKPQYLHDALNGLCLVIIYIIYIYKFAFLNDNLFYTFVGFECSWISESEYMFINPYAKIQYYELFGCVENQVYQHDHNKWSKICTLKAEGPTMSYIINRVNIFLI